MPIEKVIEKYRAGTEEKREKRESACSSASSSSGYSSNYDVVSDSAGSSSKTDEDESLNTVSSTKQGKIKNYFNFCFEIFFVNILSR